MPVFAKNGRSILFLHIPKCGGSSYEKVMTDSGWRELLSVRGMHLNELRFLRCSPQHLHWNILSLLVKAEEFDEVIALVRDPFARLKSEYAWQLIQKLTDLNPADWITSVFEEYKKDAYLYDNHIRPQTEFLAPNSKIFKLEADGVRKAVLAGLEHDCSSDKLNNLSGDKDIPSLKMTEKSPAINEAFEENRKKITDFYAKDYDALGY